MTRKQIPTRNARRFLGCFFGLATKYITALPDFWLQAMKSYLLRIMIGVGVPSPNNIRSLVVQLQIVKTYFKSRLENSHDTSF